MTRPGRAELVEQIRRAGVVDERVLDAFRVVPRAEFVPACRTPDAYEDVPLPLPHDQVTTQPSLSALMIEALKVHAGDRVLEIGTGHGFQTAVLAHLSGHVTSIEMWPELAEQARANLERQGIDNVEVLVGDGSVGVPEAAPFDGILVSAAFSRVPDPLAAQLTLGGRLVQPIGPGGAEMVTLFVRTHEGLDAVRDIIPARFVPLVGRAGFPSGQG